MSDKQKQSLVAGGLVSSLGIFIAKLIGLFYAIPFYRIIGNENIAYYSKGFVIYGYILNVATAGIPLAVAMLVSKYITFNDYKVALRIKRLSSYLMVVGGVFSCILMMLLSQPIASTYAGVTSYHRNVILCLSLALIFVPYLSASRGFLQGTKDMQISSTSQVVEQLVRVVFLLGASFIVVKVLKLDAIIAVYFAVLASAVSAIVAIYYVNRKEKAIVKDIQMKAQKQEKSLDLSSKVLTKELILIALPYLVVAIFGYSDELVNNLFLDGALKAYASNLPANAAVAGFAAGEFKIETLIQVISGNIPKIIAIPQILSLGFSAAIIPHITSAKTSKNLPLLRRNIIDCVSSVLYLLIPICICIFLYSRTLYQLIFFTTDPLVSSVAGYTLKWFSIEAFVITIGPVLTSIMMSMNFFKSTIRNVILATVAKVIVTFPLISTLGVPGIIASDIIYIGIIALLTIIELKQKCGIKWMVVVKRIAAILIASVPIFVVAFLFKTLGLSYGSSIMSNFVVAALQGGISLILYFAVSHFIGLPQTILNFDVSKYWKKR